MSGRDYEMDGVATSETSLNVDTLSLYLQRQPSPRRHIASDTEASSHGVHRAFRLRQVDACYAVSTA